MALNSAELRVLSRIISSRPSPRLPFLGYPDLLTDEATWPLQSITWRDAPKRKNAGPVWVGHGRAHLKNYPMVETKGLFQSLGCDVTVADAIRWGGEDVVINLNHPPPENMCGRFDIIIDPGTLEHCFNIAQAFDNIDRMLCVCGIVYHQNAIAFPNHGLWSISPTAYFDFYQPRGYLLGRPHMFGKTLDGNGHDVVLEPIDPFEPITASLSVAIGSYLFQKTKDLGGQSPTQCSGAMSPGCEIFPSWIFDSFHVSQHCCSVRSGHLMYKASDTFVRLANVRRWTVLGGCCRPRIS